MRRDLNALARSYGIQTSYKDMRNERHDADPEALLLVLRAMSAGVDTFDDVAEALKRRKEELRKRIVEPVLVAWDGKLGSRQLEFGYHDIEIKGQPTFVISAPKKSYFVPMSGSGPETATTQRRQGAWGVFAPIYALHSKRNPLAGDVTDFENLMDWMYGLGGSVAATLPLLGAFLDDPFEPSPYSPATRLFWNEFYIDIERIPEFTDAVPPRPKTAKFIDYRSVMAYKRAIMEELAHKFFSDGKPERLEAFNKFLRQNKGVEDYARFRAVTDRERRGWIAWPARLRDGNIEKGDYDKATKNYHLYAQWVIQEQLQTLSQKAGARGQFLYLDLPLGLHPASYDIWRNRQFFVQGVAGGAPPDPVFTKGQNWGFPPMNPEALRLNRYQYVIAYLRNHFRYAKLLRIDHVMGLHRLFWIPEELPGDKGVYVQYPAEELWAILSLESHRYKAGIVGENLGTVPPAVNAAMARHDIRQMYVVQYEIMGNPDKPKLRPVPEKSVASLNTHDMPPFRAFLDGSDINDRLDLGLLDEKTARREQKQRKVMRKALETLISKFEFRNSNFGNLRLPDQIRNPQSQIRNSFAVFLGVTGFLANSMANIVLVNIEDLWQETLPQNVPATTTERPNWQRRIRHSIEQIRKMAGVAKVLSHVFAHRSRHLPL